MLRGAAVTREVAPSKARAVAVNFILLVAVISQVVVVASLVEKCEEGSQEEGEESAIYVSILSDP
jgi:hypothetical protein